MIIIGAADQRFAIGRDNKLLAYLPEDLAFFKKHTMNKTIILGSRTLDSFKNGQPLPNRQHFVLSRSKVYDHKNIHVFRSIETLLKRVKTMPSEEVYVAGGGMIYRALLPYCEKAYITRIEKTLEADTFMPNLEELEDWLCTDEGVLLEENGLIYRHTTWQRQEKKDESGV